MLATRGCNCGGGGSADFPTPPGPGTGLCGGGGRLTGLKFKYDVEFALTFGTFRVGMHTLRSSDEPNGGGSSSSGGGGPNPAIGGSAEAPILFIGPIPPMPIAFTLNGIPMSIGVGIGIGGGKV